MIWKSSDVVLKFLGKQRKRTPVILGYDELCLHRPSYEKSYKKCVLQMGGEVQGRGDRFFYLCGIVPGSDSVNI